MKVYGVPWNPVNAHPMYTWVDSPLLMRCSLKNLQTVNRTCIQAIKCHFVIGRWAENTGSRHWFQLGQDTVEFYQLIHFKVLHRTYATPDKQYRRKLVQSYNCNICNSGAASSFLHVLGLTRHISVWRSSYKWHRWTSIYTPTGFVPCEWWQKWQKCLFSAYLLQPKRQFCDFG